MRNRTIVLGNNYVGTAFIGVYDVIDHVPFIANQDWSILDDVTTIIYAVDNKSTKIIDNWMDNYKLVADILNYCQINGVKLVLISTADLYGNNWDWADTTEDAIKLDTNNDYRLSKRVAERFLDNTDTLIIRIKNPFDSRIHEDNELYRELNREKPLAWLDTYTYLPDLVRAINILLNKNCSGIFNLVQNETGSSLHFYKKLLNLSKYAHVSEEVDNNELLDYTMYNDKVCGDINSTKIQEHVTLTPLDAAVILSWNDLVKTIDIDMYSAKV
jgi:dTDP-4-dehydrorhamnose reductase